MILKHADWQTIRAQFSEEERDAIRYHITGDRPNKEGWMIETGSMAAELRTKLMDAVTQLHNVSSLAVQKGRSAEV